LRKIPAFSRAAENEKTFLHPAFVTPVYLRENGMMDRHTAKEEQKTRNPSGPVSSALLYSILLIVLFWELDFSAAYAQAQPQALTPDNPKRILVMYSYGPTLPGYQRFIPSFISVMEKAGVRNGDLLFEYLDLLHIRDSEHRQALADMLRHKYAQLNIALIVTLHGPALGFLLKEAKDIFPKVPIVSWVLQKTFDEDIGHRVVRLQAGHDVQGTLERALELFPKTSRVVFISGVSEVELRVESEAKSVFANWEDKLKFEYTSHLSVEEMLERIANLPPHSIVIYWNVFSDTTGRTFTPRDVGSVVAKTANAPVFGLYDTLLDLGVVGGSLMSFEAEGARTGKLAIDILNGRISLMEQAEPITSSPVPMFDWQQIERWGGKAGNLPEGTVFVNRSPSTWKQYGRYLIIFIVFTLAQSLLIIGLLIHKRRRRAAEESMREAEEKYRNIFEGALEGIYETYWQGKPLDANPAAARMLGYDSPEDFLSSVVNPAHQVWVDPDEREKYFQLLQANGVVLKYECQFYRKDKSIIWVSLNSRIVRRPDGKTLSTGFIEDISERKRIELALAESRAHIIALVDSTNDFIWSVDPLNYGLVTWNKALENYFLTVRGIKIRVGMAPEHLLPPGYAILWHEFYSRALREGSFVTEYTVVAETIILLLSFNLLRRNGEVFGISIFGKDITERKRMEEELKESEERYRALVETSSDWVWEVDANAKYTYADPKVQDILGYAPQEVVGRTPFQLMPEDEARRVEAIFAEITADRRQFSGLINANLHRNGQLVVLETSGVPVFGPDGEFMGYRGMDRDVTHRKQAEEELGRYRDHLEEMIKERTTELIVAKERAEAADRLKSVFLATMSHELRTPLNSIIGFTGILQQELTGPLNEEQKKQLGMVRASGTHLLNLINDVLDISKIEAGQLQVSIETFDLRAVIERVTQAAKPLADKKGVGLEIKIAPDVNSLSSDRRRVEQILLNLLSNAIKFTEKGRIQVTCSLHGQEVSVSVIDTGIGIKSEDMVLLFKPFQQVQTGATRHFEGTGLGLSICKKLLDLLAGKIAVHSDWGKGSTFSFTLPVERFRE
jgi:PAS domain S-box-containing protein